MERKINHYEETEQKEKGCEFCNLRDYSNAPPLDNNFGWLLGLRDNEENLIVNHKGEQVYYAINYCPMCGRKLREENETD